MTSTKINESDLLTICEYMGCSAKHLVPDEKIICDRGKGEKSCLEPAFIVTDILSRISQTDEYKHLQIRISQMLLQNLIRSGINEEDLYNVGIKRIQNN